MIDARKDGGPAFPNITSDMQVDGGPGMSLRDYFAGHALTAMHLVAPYAHTGDQYFREVAAWAYRYADAMIAERSKIDVKEPGIVS